MRQAQWSQCECGYSYYTAGSGGVGPTILETSLLLASQPVLAYVDGKQVQTGNIAWLCRECCDPMAQSQLSRLIQCSAAALPLPKQHITNCLR